MSQIPKNSNIKDLIINIIKCYTKKELDEKINAWRNGKAIVNIYDIARCGYRYRLSIDNPKPAIDNISKEDVFRRYIINYGIISVIKKAYEIENAEIEKNLTYRFTIDGREVELVGICDIFLPKEKEVILVRHVKELKDGKPKKHHIEQSLVLHWLACKDDILAKPRILYYIGFGKEFKEFIIETNIIRNGRLVKEFEERLKERLKFILGGEGPFNSWECSVCPYESSCSKKQSSYVKIGSIISEGEWLWYEDALLTRTMKFIRRLIERDIEFIESYERKSAGTSSSLRIGVTKLTRCPMEFWFSMLIPYATLPAKLSKRVLRGDIVHSGITYIMSRINDVKQYCTDIDEVGRSIEGIEVEKKLFKSFSVDEYNVEISGRADIVLVYRNDNNKNIIVELKTAEDIQKAKPYYEEQLKIYLNMLENSKGKLVYITEAKEKTGTCRERKVIEFNEIEVDKPIDDDHIKNRIKDIIKAKEGLIDINEIAEKYRNLCIVCEFKDLCIVGSSLAKHRTRKTT